MTVSPASLAKRVGAYIQPTTLQVGELAVRDGKLVQGRTPSSPALIALTENRFKQPVSGAEIQFADGEHAGFEMHSAERTSAEVPVAGTGNSDERRARTVRRRVFQRRGQRAIHGDGGVGLDVIMAHRYVDPFTARNVFADGFLGNYTVLFTRSKRTSERIRGDERQNPACQVRASGRESKSCRG